MDYRESHQQRGENYDELLAQEPISAYMTRIEKDLLANIIPVLFPNSMPAYLDFACGTARITSIIAPLSQRAYGVDISAGMLEKAKEKCPHTAFFNADITRDVLDIEPVNLITAFRFFGNAQHSLREEVFAALNRLLQKGGYLIINNHRNPWSLRAVLGRMNGATIDLDLTPVKLKKLLNDHGFIIKKTYGIGTWIFRSALEQPKYLDSSMARHLEHVSSLPGSYLISPDAIIVARKR
ncbi:Methyltransferase domain-containing protein [Nitrosomonas aestuarii]|uniref:Methyltransferase domain-containing protein n=1 Tax=Nitrosomonas aestuarii TaxID=52441 RepID=A0A1I4CL77_9PROT|nr:class I SAM-dependent methyltransferase [Nitrosomonas aestuarii]SFK81998.1 Methyltransferase domain-containing protein [Nitrosomonas aestuarii]